MESKELICNNCKQLVSSANFATHSAFCERNIFLCTICEEAVRTSEKKQHLEECHAIVSCDQCGARFEKWMLSQHLESCPKRLITCEFCEAEFLVDEFSEHIEFCGSRTEKCLKCQKYIMLKDKERHTKVHSYEKELHGKLVAEEVKQNSINEVISKTGVSEKISKENCNILSPEKNMVNRNDLHLKTEIPEGAVRSVPDKKKEISNHYTICPICSQSIARIDMNTHIPNCTTLAGKCSLCGETMENSKMKEHMKEHFQRKSSITVPEKDKFDAVWNSGNFVQRVQSYGSSHDAKDISKHYTVCHICSQSIAWIDMNTHVPNCATLAGKCSLCGEAVENSKMKEHMKEHWQQKSSIAVPEKDKFDARLNIGNFVQEVRNHDAKDQNSLCQVCNQWLPLIDMNTHLPDCATAAGKCPICLEKVANSEIREHIKEHFQKKYLKTNCARNSSQSFFECPLCSENIPENDKSKHMTFDCKTLLKDSEFKACGSASYAEAAKKTSGERQKPIGNATEVCIMCRNKIPLHKWSEHKRNCERVKFPCLHCGEMIDVACEDIHVQECPKLNLKQSNRSRPDHSNKSPLSNYYQYKGAVPKNTSFSNMVRPVSAQCSYCKTTLNADILSFHERECIHRPVKCSYCSNPIPSKDFGTHNCKAKRRQEKIQQKKQEKFEDKNDGWKRTFMSLNPFSNPEENDKNADVNSYAQNYFYQDYSPAEGIHQPLYFSRADTISDDIPLPCEFCNKMFPASELVLHETGCKPDIACYAKKDSSEDIKQKKSNSWQDSSPSLSSEKVLPKDSVHSNRSQNFQNSPFYDESKTFFPSSKHKKVERDIDYTVNPGEFLPTYCKITSSEWEPETVSKQQNYQKSGERKKESSNIQSVWNHKSSLGPKAESGSSKQTSNHSDVEKNLDHSEMPISINENDASEAFQRLPVKNPVEEDAEMAVIFKFIDGADNENEIFYDAENEEPTSYEGGKSVELDLSNDDAHVQEKYLEDKSTIDNKLKEMDKQVSNLVSDITEEQKEHLMNSKRYLSDFKFGNHGRKDAFENAGKDFQKTRTPLKEGTDTVQDEIKRSSASDMKMNDFATWKKWRCKETSDSD